MREIRQIILWAILTLCITWISTGQTGTPPSAPAAEPSPAPLSVNEIIKIINPPAKAYSAADIAARAQPVTTTQGFIDDAAEAFTEVVALRDLALKFLTGERPATEAERAGAKTLVDQLNKLIDGWKTYAAMYGDMVKAQQEFITFQFGVIKQLQAIIQNPPGNVKAGFWSKLWKGIKRTAEMIIIFLAGRASGIVGENINYGNDIYDPGRISGNIAKLKLSVRKREKIQTRVLLSLLPEA